ncbi:MAG: hypothetical protein VYE68_12330 [Acidobacteriota bacterium]|nr:hypothetical protein [Acidobacteriota bacterium]
MTLSRSSVQLCFVWTVSLALWVTATGAVAQPLDKPAIAEFMRTADVVAAEEIGTGVTNPWRLTLSDGRFEHDVAFQSVDKQRDRQRLGRRQELNFVDAYRYNIAAYRVAELLGLDHMMPVTVERSWDGRRGAVSWWIDDVMFDERTRLDGRHWPDDMQRYNEQYYRMLVFAELVYDTDRNQTNVLYGSDWNLWMIDFSRAFRVWAELQAPQNVPRCDRQLLQGLRDLTRARLETHTHPYLNGGEIDAVLERRDKLVDHFDDLIAKKGESLVLY